MSAKDQVHHHVVIALQKDGWTITHDPFKVQWKNRKLQIDIGAEKLMEAVTQKTEKYRQIIPAYLTRFAAIPNLESNVRDRVLFDPQHDTYALIAEGWDGEDRVHFIIAHLEIINDKIWIQADNTDVAIARELEAAGVPKSDIVLGFRAPSVRPFTEYAAA